MSLLSGVEESKGFQDLRCPQHQVKKGLEASAHQGALDSAETRSCSLSPFAEAGVWNTHIPQTQSGNCLLNLKSVTVTLLLQTPEAVGPEKLCIFSKGLAQAGTLDTDHSPGPSQTKMIHPPFSRSPIFFSKARPGLRVG